MPLDDQHPVWPEGPDCDEQCPGKWSQYHDGFAWGYEKALAAERARIRREVEGLPLAWDSEETLEDGRVIVRRLINRAAVLRIIDADAP